MDSLRISSVAWPLCKDGTHKVWRDSVPSSMMSSVSSWAHAQWRWRKRAGRVVCSSSVARFQGHVADRHSDLYSVRHGAARALINASTSRACAPSPKHAKWRTRVAMVFIRLALAIAPCRLGLACVRGVLALKHGFTERGSRSHTAASRLGTTKTAAVVARSAAPAHRMPNAALFARRRREEAAPYEVERRQAKARGIADAANCSPTLGGKRYGCVYPGGGLGGQSVVARERR